MTKVKQRPRRSDSKHRHQEGATTSPGQDRQYVLNRADFPMLSDDAFAFLQMIDASPAFRAVLADLATK